MTYHDEIESIEYRHYASAYKAGKKAASKITIGKLFIGAFGYADSYVGSTKDCRDTIEWKGAFAGYLDGLPECRSITVDSTGIIISID